jgi:hypothetical protein
LFEFLKKIYPPHSTKNERERKFETNFLIKFRKFQNKMNSNINKPNQANVVNSQVQQLQDVMRENIQKAVKRGEQLERLEERTDYLDASANEFKTTSNKTKQKFYLKNLKWTILLAVVIILILAMIILSVYLSFRK